MDLTRCLTVCGSYIVPFWEVLSSLFSVFAKTSNILTEKQGMVRTLFKLFMPMMIHLDGIDLGNNSAKKI